MKKSYLLALASSISFNAISQCNGWQQRISYDMDVALDVNTHRFHGSQRITYWNNGPDTLYTLFFHLYFNAFRPGSEMDVRSRTIEDPDDRIGDRIAGLKADEMGELVVTEMRQSKQMAKLEHLGTVLKVHLSVPIPPGKSTSITSRFTGQVPIQIRRSGRDNAEGVAYSMTQWYPKMAEYDERGWHATPYVAREYHGVWGDFNVRITLPEHFVVAATGTLMNTEEIGHGYSRSEIKRAGAKDLTWNFKAKNVHDFAWAADPGFNHTTEQVPNGPLLHFFFKDDEQFSKNWSELPNYMVKAFQFMDVHFGKYPYPQYSFVQGGDGGMEYPMLTLITGKRKLGSLVGVSVHESVHSWYYGMLASDEGSYPWMDEGFTEYASSKVMAHLFEREGDPHASAYNGYFALARSGKEEPMSTHADHFNSNFAYGISTYSKGEVFVQQLGAVIGDRTLRNGLMRYYDKCKFKHPDPVDVERIMEQESGLELDWYFNEWINTTNHVDYGISRVLQIGDSVHITIERIGKQLMPVDMLVQRIDGTDEFYHIPLSLMLGNKEKGSEEYEFTSLAPWLWPELSYTVRVKARLSDLGSIEIDPIGRVADIDRSNDSVLITEGFGGMLRK